MKRLPEKEREAIEVEEKKMKRLDLQEIKQNLWRKWRGRQDQGEKDEKNDEKEIRMKTNKITNILAKLEEEKKLKKKREDEWKDRRKRMIEIGREKQAENEKKNRDRKDRLKKKSELEGTWEMLRWVARFIDKNKDRWEDERKERERERRMTIENYQHNDTWADDQMAKYVQGTESIEDKMKELEIAEVKPPDNSTHETEEKVDHVVTEVESEKASVQRSIDSFVSEVNSLEKIQFATASAMEKFSEKLKVRLEILVQKSRKVNDTLRSSVNDFYDTECAKLDKVLLEICTKVEDSVSSPLTPARLPSSSTSGKEQVYLEKSKPPKFKGDDVDYPEFKRKWLSIVSKANLPPESEVDKLRDSLPNDARDQLYGVTTTEKAWEILDKRFGDPRIISMKLKAQLKNIQCDGKTDPERVISLTIKVRTIVTKLESLKMSGALEHDSEFLSAVYCALPNKDQQRWLDYDKTSNHWEDMLKFLDRAYNQATEELSLLATYKADNDKKAPVKGGTNKSFAATIKKGDGGRTDDSDDENKEDAKEKARKRSEEFCGKCPVCSSLHTWTRLAGDKWPSDRLLSCRKFNDMNVSSRAKAVEKYKGCPRCTSWNHARDKCKMTPNNCGKDDGAGSKCKGDHSRLLCGSGNAYCFAAKARREVVHNSNDSSDAFSDVNEDADTVQYFQDIPVEGHDVTARTFWDDGSTRVLIREEFAESLGLVKKDIKYTLESVGFAEKRTGHIYLLSLVDMYGTAHKIWGYSIDRIMLSSVPDMAALEATFPHVPREAFKAMAEAEVDILVGLNMSQIFPVGGDGVDRRGGVRVKRSIFSPGWVVGGVLPEVQPRSGKYSLSTKAVVARTAKVQVVPESPINPDFWETDQLGVSPPPKCDRCKKCLQVGECSESHAQYTAKSQAELDLIRANTKLINGEVWCDYPFIKDPSCLPNNRTSAIKVAEKVMASLKKDNMLQVYNE